MPNKNETRSHLQPSQTNENDTDDLVTIKVRPQLKERLYNLGREVKPKGKPISLGRLIETIMNERQGAPAIPPEYAKSKEDRDVLRALGSLFADDDPLTREYHEKSLGLSSSSSDYLKNEYPSESTKQRPLNPYCTSATYEQLYLAQLYIRVIQEKIAAAILKGGKPMRKRGRFYVKGNPEEFTSLEVSAKEG